MASCSGTTYLVFEMSNGSGVSYECGSSRICYTMDKLSLSDDQVLNAYFYEEGGPRALLLTIGAKDVNRARNRL